MTNIAESVCTEASPAVLPEPPRCQFVFADARRCRMPALCPAHARAQAAKETALAAEPPEAIDLAPLSGEFTTATEINRALGKVFLLLAENRIPRRNAVALGYIAQLLLQTLPAVRQEIVSVCGQESWRETLESAVCEEEEEPAVNGSESSAKPVAAEEDDRHEAEKESDPSSASEGAAGAPHADFACGDFPPAPSESALQPKRAGVGYEERPGHEKRIEGPASWAPADLPVASAAAQHVHPTPPPESAAESKCTWIKPATSPQLFRNEHLQKKGGRGGNLLLPNRNGRRIWSGNGRPFRLPS